MGSSSEADGAVEFATVEFATVELKLGFKGVAYVQVKRVNIAAAMERVDAGIAAKKKLTTYRRMND